MENGLHMVLHLLSLEIVYFWVAQFIDDVFEGFCNSKLISSGSENSTGLTCKFRRSSIYPHFRAARHLSG
jgi:hypothetical protein